MQTVFDFARDGRALADLVLARRAQKVQRPVTGCDPFGDAMFRQHRQMCEVARERELQNPHHLIALVIGWLARIG